MIFFKKSKRQKEKKPLPLIKLTLIAIPTIAIVLITALVLNISGFFMSPAEKCVGTWSRTRTGTYSGEKYTEAFAFKSDGTGSKAYKSPDGYVSKTEFTWEITPTKILVINSRVKYYWNSEFADYYNAAARTAKKYWYVSKNELYFGENTSATYETYNRKT